MANVVFRGAPPPAVEQPTVDIPEPKRNNEEVQSGESDNEPVELRDTGGRSVVLDALNINENLNSLSQEDKANIQEVKDYVLQIIKSKGVSPTVSAFKKTLDNLKGEMGLAEESEPSIILDRISGVVKAWRDLSFVKDAGEKKRIFFKLANLKSSKEMNKAVFDTMSKYNVWQ
jgi:hypothetical protein